MADAEKARFKPLLQGLRTACLQGDRAAQLDYATRLQTALADLRKAWARERDTARSNEAPEREPPQIEIGEAVRVTRFEAEATMSWFGWVDTVVCETMEGGIPWFEPRLEADSIGRLLDRHFGGQDSETGRQRSKPKRLPRPGRETRPVPLSHACAWFNVKDHRTVRRMIEAGTIAARQHSDRLWVFDLDECPNAIDAEPG